MIPAAVLAFCLFAPSPALAVFTATPLSDLRTGTYLGFEGGLYPGGTNEPPGDHLAAGLAAAAAIRPLDLTGSPSPTGKIVLLSIGMSNTTQEFCAAGGRPPCESWSFVGQALADPAVNRTTLALINGARGGQTADSWSSASGSNYDRIRDTDLASAGLTETQVQVAWVKVANSTPTRSLPASDADAYRLVSLTGNVVRALRTRYRNLRIVYFASRIYAGYASTTLNPEPYAYESGLAMKWVVKAQIDQLRGGGVDPRAGDLSLAGGAPWLAWGPYLWADGTNPRADGLTWARSELENDGTHPSQTGEQKVGALLLGFLKGHVTSRSWFLAAPPQVLARRFVPTVASAPGRFDSYFRTSLQLHNPDAAPASGRLVFHVQGTSGTDADPFLVYGLAPGETRSIPDLLAAIGTSGVGSLDILVETGNPPTASVRVFNDAGTAGTMGTGVDVFSADTALKTGEKGSLLVPADLVSFRLNIGVRSLEAGVSLSVTLRDAAGKTVRSVTRRYAPNLYEQVTASDFVDGTELSGGESMGVEVTQGSAIVFGATGDNRTQDPSLHFARAAR